MILVPLAIQDQPDSARHAKLPYIPRSKLGMSSRGSNHLCIVAGPLDHSPLMGGGNCLLASIRNSKDRHIDNKQVR